MPALFPRWTNTAVAVSLGALALGGGLAVAAPMVYARTPFFAQQGFPVEQPVQFDHRHHVSDDGIDCRYCHEAVETSSSAGIPSVSLCMNCHSQIWNQSPKLDPVRAAYFSGRPLVWNRVHDLPDFVYFNHAIHVNKGVGCVTCHGRVDQMPVVQQTAPLLMGWCLDCHRDPAPNLRPREEVTNMSYQPPAGEERSLGARLAAEYDVHARTSCTTCHR